MYYVMNLCSESNFSIEEWFKIMCNHKNDYPDAGDKIFCRLKNIAYER